MELIFRRPVDGAMFALNRGMKVFPLLPDNKKPAVKDWQTWANESTEQKVKNYATANPTANWGVFCGGSGITVLDLDKKNDVDGEKELKNILKEEGTTLSNTLLVQTPSGGKHLYYTGEYRNTASTIGRGIDTRGTGGYVVAPGSRIGEEVYQIMDDSAPLPFPSFLAKRMRNKEAPVLDEEAPVLEGERNSVLASLAGTMRKRGLGEEAILAALNVVNEQQLERPLDPSEVRQIANSISRYKPKDAEAASDFVNPGDILAIKASTILPSDIPKRDWIMSHRYIGGFISVVVAPGGVGKSTFVMHDAVAIASGQDITGYHVKKKGAVWIYNTEDPLDEIKRRIVAISLTHKIPLEQMENIHITSGRDKPLILAKESREGVVLNKDAIASTIKYIRDNNIVLFIADPFVRTHECSENDNMQIDKVVWAFQRISDATGCAICLVHHTKKAGNNSNTGDMEAARGASSLVYAARIAHTLSHMKEEEARDFGIPIDKRRWYFRLDNAKANLQPPAEKADWYQKVSVTLLNGDDVGAVEKVDLVGFKQEKEKDASYGEATDLAMCLSSFMSTGDTLPLASAIPRIFNNEKYQHLFAHSTLSEKVKVNILIRILQSGKVQKGEKIFELDMSNATRSRQKIVCKFNDIETMLM